MCVFRDSYFELCETRGRQWSGHDKCNEVLLSSNLALHFKQLTMVTISAVGSLTVFDGVACRLLARRFFDSRRAARADWLNSNGSFESLIAASVIGAISGTRSAALGDCQIDAVVCYQQTGPTDDSELLRRVAVCHRMQMRRSSIIGWFFFILLIWNGGAVERIEIVQSTAADGAPGSLCSRLSLDLMRKYCEPLSKWMLMSAVGASGRRLWF